MSNDQCPICYEDYNSEEPRLVPRQLNNCHDVICWGCLEEALFENELYCPQCGSQHTGASVEDISAECNPAAMAPASPETPSPPPDEVVLEGALTASPPQPTRERCLMEGCHRRAGIGAEDGFCLKHSTSKKRSSLMKETEIAESLKATSLGQVSIDGTKVKLMDPLVAGSAFAPDDLIERFSRQSRMELGEVMTLIDRAKSIMTPESNVLRLEAPVVVVGDIHGQFYDLVNMLKVGGSPSDESGGKQYLFLGDYVDRGHFSCEVMLLLLALKVVHPHKVWLIRGNHECRSVSGHFGFKEECKKKYGVAVYYNFLLMFQTMPLAAVISTDYGNIFACHGGISPSLNLLEDIESLDRFVEPEVNSGLLDMLWSDPVHDSNILPVDYDEEAEEEYYKYLEIDWRPNPARGCSYCFGYAAIVAFLQKNDFVCLLRAHEVQEEGFHEHFQSVIVTRRVQLTSPRAHKPSPVPAAVTEQVSSKPPSPDDPYVCLSKEVSVGSNEPAYLEMGKCLPLVITVFSAPNYCDRYENKAAILTLGRALDEFQFVQYDCVEHPVPDDIANEMNNQIAAVVASCPYMPTSFQDFVRLALELGFEDDLFEDEFPSEADTPSLGHHHSIDNIVVHTKDGVDHPITDLSQAPVPKPCSLFPSQTIEEPPRAQTTPSKAMLTPEKTAGIDCDNDSESGDDDIMPSPLRTDLSMSIRATSSGAAGFGTPPLNRSFTSPNRRPSYPSPFLKSASSNAAVMGRQMTPDKTMKNTSPAVPLFQRPPLSKTPSETIMGTATRRMSMNSPMADRKSMGQQGYVRQRINNIESLNIEVRSNLETPRTSKAHSRQDKISINKWRERRTSAPVTRRQSLVLSSSVGAVRGNSLIMPRPKLDSDDDTDYSTSTMNTPKSLRSIKRGSSRRNSYGSEVSELSPPFISSASPAPVRRNSTFGHTAPLSPLIPTAILSDSEKMEADQRNRTEAKEEKATVDVVQFEGKPDIKLTKRQSFAVASAFDAINERHPIVVLDHLQDLEKSTDIMLASSPGEELNYMDSMDEMDRVEPQLLTPRDADTSAGTVTSDQGADSSCLTSSKPFTRTSVKSLFPSVQSGSTLDEGGGLDAPALSDIAGLDLQAPDIIELLEDNSQARRRSLSDSRPFLTEHSDSMQKTVVFTREELLGLRLMFSLFDRTGNGFIEYEDLVAYAEETGDFMRLRDASLALDILDIDGDGSIGLLDFIHFASRLQKLYDDGMLNTAGNKADAGNL